MSEPILYELQYPDEPPKRSVLWCSVLSIVLLTATCRVVPWSWSHAKAFPRGQATVTDRWESLAHFIKGEEAQWQELVYEDGAIEKGPLQNGRRHGQWKLEAAGKTLVLHYREGNRQ